MRFKMKCPDCPGYGANQHAAWFKFCPRHYALVCNAAALKGIPPEQLLGDAINEYVQRHHPDYKRWVA